MKESSHTIVWQIKSFDQLSNLEIYNILRLRAEVFVVEQEAAYQDVDNVDLHSLHLMGQLNEKLVTYCRLIPPGGYFEESCMGRVVTAADHRRKGYSRQCVYLALQAMQTFFGTAQCRISAQEYLTDFYRSFGFTIVSERYLEDGLPHFQMLKQK